MKRMLAIAAAFMCIFAAGCGKTETAKEETEAVTEETIAEYIPTQIDISSEILAYITEFDGYAAVLDEVELAEVPSERGGGA